MSGFFQSVVKNYVAICRLNTMQFLMWPLEAATNRDSVLFDTYVKMFSSTEPVLSLQIITKTVIYLIKIPLDWRRYITRCVTTRIQRSKGHPPISNSRSDGKVLSLQQWASKPLDKIHIDAAAQAAWRTVSQPQQEFTTTTTTTKLLQISDPSKWDMCVSICTK